MIATPAQALSQLTHARWALPALAVVGRERGCKVVTLRRKLGAPAPSLRRALSRLEAMDLVVRNPGHGHPMRPELILGAAGRGLAEASVELLAWIEADCPGPSLFKKWQLPLLVATSPGAWRFGQLHEALALSPRALAIALKTQAELGLLERHIEAGYPPTPLYSPTPRSGPGRELASELARGLVG